MDKKTQVIEKIFDILGEILAVLTIILYAVLFVNAVWSFIPENVLKVLQVIKDYAALVVVLVVGIECIVKRNFFFKFVFTVLVGIIIICHFFPGTWENITKVF